MKKAALFKGALVRPTSSTWGTGVDVDAEGVSAIVDAR